MMITNLLTSTWVNTFWQAENQIGLMIHRHPKNKISEFFENCWGYAFHCVGFWWKDWLCFLSDTNEKMQTYGINTLWSLMSLWFTFNVRFLTLIIMDSRKWCFHLYSTQKDCHAKLSSNREIVDIEVNLTFPCNRRLRCQLWTIKGKV